jgi:hypothetical protein|tara:strand:- start:3296 stop:3703 length:408 start_codon:yes stop_codon:yes gene_type:complete
MKIPIGELIDKMSILRIKVEKIGESQSKLEYEKYRKEIELFEDVNKKLIKRWCDQLYIINLQIWNIEYDLRQKISECDNQKRDIIKLFPKNKLKEIGKKHLLVQRLMKERDNIKNEITEITGDGYKIYKLDHPSN